MKVYVVNRAFVDYGMYHGIGEVIKDASLISNFVVKLHDGYILATEDYEASKKSAEVLAQVEVSQQMVPAIPAKVLKDSKPGTVAGAKVAQTNVKQKVTVKPSIKK